MLEVTSGIGCAILFHWIVHDTSIITTTQLSFFKEVSLAWDEQQGIYLQIDRGS